MTSKFFVIYDGEDCVEIVKAPSAPPNTLSGPFPSYDEAVCHLWHWDYRRPPHTARAPQRETEPKAERK